MVNSNNSNSTKIPLADSDSTSINNNVTENNLIRCSNTNLAADAVSNYINTCNSTNNIAETASNNIIRLCNANIEDPVAIIASSSDSAILNSITYNTAIPAITTATNSANQPDSDNSINPNTSISINANNSTTSLELGISEATANAANLRLPGSRLDSRLTAGAANRNINCPRCKSEKTKFCYFNNYSKSQPRYLCKSCRRYWTEGGNLRDVPIGGGSRKNKRSNINSSSANLRYHSHAGQYYFNNNHHFNNPNLNYLTQDPRAIIPNLNLPSSASSSSSSSSNYLRPSLSTNVPLHNSFDFHSFNNMPLPRLHPSLDYLDSNVNTVSLPRAQQEPSLRSLNNQVLPNEEESLIDLHAPNNLYLPLLQEERSQRSLNNQVFLPNEEASINLSTPCTNDLQVPLISPQHLNHPSTQLRSNQSLLNQVSATHNLLHHPPIIDQLSPTHSVLKYSTSHPILNRATTKQCNNIPIESPHSRHPHYPFTNAHTLQNFHSHESLPSHLLNHHQTHSPVPYNFPVAQGVSHELQPPSSPRVSVQHSSFPFQPTTNVSPDLQHHNMQYPNGGSQPSSDYPHFVKIRDNPNHDLNNEATSPNFNGALPYDVKSNLDDAPIPLIETNSWIRQQQEEIKPYTSFDAPIRSLQNQGVSQSFDPSSTTIRKPIVPSTNTTIRPSTSTSL